MFFCNHRSNILERYCSFVYRLSELFCFFAALSIAKLGKVPKERYDIQNAGRLAAIPFLESCFSAPQKCFYKKQLLFLLMILKLRVSKLWGSRAVR